MSQLICGKRRDARELHSSPDRFAWEIDGCLRLVKKLALESDVVIENFKPGSEFFIILSHSGDESSTRGDQLSRNGGSALKIFGL